MLEKFADEDDPEMTEVLKYIENIYKLEEKKSLIEQKKLEREKAILQARIEEERKKRQEHDLKAIGQHEEETKKPMLTELREAQTTDMIERLKSNPANTMGWTINYSKNKYQGNNTMSAEERDKYFEFIKNFQYEDEYDDTMDFDEGRDKRKNQTTKVNIAKKDV